MMCSCRLHLAPGFVALQGAGVENAKQKEGKLTGTSADLRRVRVPALKQKLKEAGVPQEDYEKLTRWPLVALLRFVIPITHL